MGNQTTETLQNLGLSENEAELYSLMLKHPRSTVQQLQTRTPFSRTLLYHILDQLVQKSLVSASKDSWRTTYIAESPERLYDILASREEEFRERTQALRALVPELKHEYRLAGNRPDVRILDGIPGYKKALEDVIVSAPETVYAYYPPLAQKRPGIELRDAHDGRRVHKKIHMHVLLPDEAGTRTLVQQRRYNDYTRFRVNTTALDAFNVDVMLYSGKILYTTYNSGEPTVTLIEDRPLYDMQQQLFHLLWETSEDITLLSTKTV